jgi:hypothetical protein
MRLAAYVIVLAAIIVLLMPTSRAGQAVVAVTGSLSGMLRS